MRQTAIIFDLDGVICHTDEFHFKAWQAVAAEIGVPFDRTVNNQLRGVSRMDSLDIILQQYHGKAFTKKEKQMLAEQKNKQYCQLLKQMTPADLSKEVKQTLDTLRGAGKKLAIGSSSKNAPEILRRIGLEHYFDAVSDGNNITRSKPDPQVFLMAAEMLGIAPSQCLIVEDAIAGAKAGFAGGFSVACVGDAAAAGVGDYNLAGFSELLQL